MQRASLASAMLYSMVLVLALATSFGVAGADTAAIQTPPVLTVPGAQTVTEGQLLAFDVTAVDPDGQSVFLRTLSMPTGATFQDHRNGSGSFGWTPTLDQAGSYTVTFIATDSFGESSSRTVGISVLNANSAPVLNAIGDRTVERGSTVFVSLSGYDPDGDAITYSATGLPSYATLSDFGSGSGDLTLAPVSSTPLGATAITVRLSDGSLDASETFDVTVVASSAANPPVLAPIGTQTVAEGEPRSATLSATDPDGDFVVWTVSIPGFANVTVTGDQAGSSTARLDLAPGYCDAGTYDATVTVSDGSLTDSESFSIVVADRNRAPAWNAPGGGYAVSLSEGGSASLSVAAADPDEACGAAAPALSIAGSDAGTALTLSIADAGDGTGTLHLTASAGSAGSYHVTLRASDPSAPTFTQDAGVAVTVLPSGGQPLQARAWFQPDPLRLASGRPRIPAYLEPVDGTFALESVDLSSIRLSRDGDATGASIAPMPGEFALGSDRDHNGVNELQMAFAKDDLRALFAGMVDPSTATLTMTASLTGGGSVVASLGQNVIPMQRKNSIQRIGPNPLNPEAVIRVRNDEAGFLRVRVFDMNGRLVRTLLDVSDAPAGEQDVRFDGRDERSRQLSSGRYFVRVESRSGVDAAPITILK